jgi:hypothetical protein
LSWSDSSDPVAAAFEGADISHVVKYVMIY